MASTSSSSSSTRHLVGVWNPSYATDAMDATIGLLLDSARMHRAGGDVDDVYVWWGKVRSSNRQRPLPHLNEVVALDETLRADEAATEMHLYLTDYRSLYVAHVAEITTDDIAVDDDEVSHVPAFYREGKFRCDCWFRLFDIRRLVFDDTLGVVDELKKLRNTHYADRPVSIYGGMVDLPLIVTRTDGARFFDPDVRAALTDGRFWVEFDAARSGVGQMEQELRDNLLGEAVWKGLDPAARGFIATAESLFRMHRHDAAFDFGAVAIELAKAFEVQTNAILRQALAGVPERDRRVNVDGQSVDVASGTHWSLGALARIIGEDERLNQLLKKRLERPGAEWFAASLPPILRELAELRNPAAHSARVGRAAVVALRNRLLGVGSLGVVSELGRVRARDQA
jgi:hypothetical protein